MIHHRFADGATVDAEQYDGTSASVHRIMDLIGTMGVNNTEHGLMVNRQDGALPFIIPPTSWVVATRSSWTIVGNASFSLGYHA